MPVLRNFVLILVSLLLLIRCNSNQDNDVETAFTFNLELPTGYAYVSAPIHPVSLIGEWGYSFPFYSSNLILKEDGTFIFHEQGCTGHGHSEGEWFKYDNRILLKSFDRYATNKPPEIIESVEPITSSKPSSVQKMKANGEIEFTIDPSIFNTTVSHKLPYNDTANVYFDNVLLTLESDTLYRLDNNGFRTERKYILLTKQ